MAFLSAAAALDLDLGLGSFMICLLVLYERVFSLQYHDIPPAVSGAVTNGGRNARVGDFY